jgi:hypothetical protein
MDVFSHRPIRRALCKNAQISYTFNSFGISMLKAIPKAGNHSGKAELTCSGNVVITAEGHKK